SQRRATMPAVSRDGSLAPALQQTRISQPVDVGGERRRGAAPLELVHIPEESRVSPEGRQILEHQCEIATLAKDGRRKRLNIAVLVEEPRRRDRSDPRNAWVSVLRVAHEREEVGNQGRLHPELLA